MKKKILSMLLALATALTALCAIGVTAGAKSTLTVTGKLSGGKYIIDLSGLTEKQYLQFVNNEKGYRVELYTEDRDMFIFTAADFTKKSSEPAIPGCENGKKVYCGVSGKGFLEYSTWNPALSLEGLYGTAEGNTWGFRWIFSADDNTVSSFMPHLTSCAKLYCCFKNVYLDPLKPGKLSSEQTVPAKWTGETVSFELQENTFRKSHISAVLTIPAADYTKFRSTKNSVLELGLWCGNTATTLKMQQDGSISYLSKQSGTDISKKVFVDAKQQTDGTVKYAISFKSTSKAAKSLLSEEITGLYKITAGKKTIAGSSDKVQLRGLPEETTAPEKPTLFLKGSSIYMATIGWNEQSGVDGYQVYMSVNGGKFTKVDTTGTFPRLYEIKNINTDDNTYKIRIRGYVKPVGKKTLYSKWSNTVTIKK